MTDAQSIQPEFQEVRVELGDRSYSIVIGSGILGSVKKWMEAVDLLSAATHAVVVTDRTVNEHYGDWQNSLAEQMSWKVDKLVVDDGETSKSMKTLDSLLQKMVKIGADRSTVVIALGGGVVGDLAGFVAATYMRGVSFVQIPTSLLAQVDSSVGGKVGVNLPQGKNLVGSFLQPDLVLIDPTVLKTLDQRNFSAGMAEVIKYGVIMDRVFFRWLENHAANIRSLEMEFLSELIKCCCRMKAAIVKSDERETSGLRAILNYGHTLGHAIEATAGYGELLHGEAISIGMNFAGILATKLGRFDQESLERQNGLLEFFGLPTRLKSRDGRLLIQAMSHDKKSQQGALRFVLPAQLGQAELVSDIDREQIEKALQEVME